MAKTLSPLRYPGGKTKLYKYTKKLIIKNDLKGCSYAEPYAGGCGLALELLYNGIVSNLVLNDIDVSIYSLWKTILTNPHELINKIKLTNISIEEWHIQKNIYDTYKNNDYSILDIAFSTLFLNRTNYSGILKAGPLGGKKQSGRYLIDCRFNKDKIIQKIELIHSLSDKIQFHNFDALDFLSLLNKSKEETLIFMDPPYYEKGQELYINFYNPSDHMQLSDKITNSNHKWVITYDNVEQIKDLYQGFNQEVYNLNYSVQKKYKAKEIMIYSDDLIMVPF